VHVKAGKRPSRLGVMEVTFPPMRPCTSVATRRVPFKYDDAGIDQFLDRATARFATQAEAVTEFGPAGKLTCAGPGTGYQRAQNRILCRRKLADSLEDRRCIETLVSLMVSEREARHCRRPLASRRR